MCCFLLDSFACSVVCIVCACVCVCASVRVWCGRATGPPVPTDVILCELLSLCDTERLTRCNVCSQIAWRAAKVTSGAAPVSASLRNTSATSARIVWTGATRPTAIHVSCTHTRTHAHTCAHTRTHTRTRTHMHTHPPTTPEVCL